MREAARERRARARQTPAEADREVRAKIAAMGPGDRTIAGGIHELVRRHAPTLVPRTWYGMPAYARADGEIVCFVQPAGKFKQRYLTLGFADAARLDDGRMWPTAYAVEALTPTEESAIAALLRRAVG
jgi:uncharacterized protein YdhG (YjbR/CyaY superfamily)